MCAPLHNVKVHMCMRVNVPVARRLEQLTSAEVALWYSRLKICYVSLQVVIQTIFR